MKSRHLAYVLANEGAKSVSLGCHGCQIWQDSLVIQLRKKAPPVGPELRAVVDRIAEPAILLGGDYKVVAANEAYRKAYGESRVVGRRCFEVSHGYASPCDENGESCPLRATLESGRRQRVFHVHHGPLGPHHVDVELEPVLDVDGRAVYFLERLREVHEASARPEGEFVGRSPAFVHALGLLRRAAPADVPVLLLGESGTGKELAARAVHRMSRRASGPFVPVECSGLPESLFESELFGHEQGAFTGASKSKRGLVDAAAGGTLFLDEIGDVPASLQVKLLRLLESGMFRRVGGTEPHRADFRLVCATHRDLAAMVAAGSFRQDLFFRINAFPVTLPALRDRRDDVPLLADALLAQRHSSKRLHSDALARLMAHDFPGNVRELRNLLDRMVLLADGDTLLVEHLPPELGASRAPSATTTTAPSMEPFTVRDIAPLDAVEHAYLRWAQTRFADRASLARALGISERTLYRKLEPIRPTSSESED